MDRRTFIKWTAQAGALAMLQMATGCKVGSKPTKSKVALPDLPFSENGLEPHMSGRTISFHYGKHHRAYVEATNRLTQGTRLAGLPLEEIIAKSRGGKESAALFNNAAQVYNHNFYWQSMSPGGGGRPQGVLGEMIAEAFKSYQGFGREFTQAAKSWFGSGWVWLVSDKGSLKIVRTANADTPLGQGPVPLLTLDLWEHAYYLDHQNRRGEYIETFLEHLANWDHAAESLDTGPKTA